jgi:FSR family fosmidomycin resistance protein-like MFS transporter
MLPFLISAYGLSYAQASALVLGSSVMSSVIQPLFGWIGDRVEKPWLMSLGIFIAGLGITLIGVFSNYVILFLCAMLTGIGVALFHPEGGRLASAVAGQSKGEGMSNFGVGGTLGFSGGALLVTGAFSIFDIHGAIVFIIPATIMALALLTQSKKFRELNKAEEEFKASGKAGVQKDNWPEFWKVTIVNVFRAIIFQSFQVFIPLFWVGVFMVSEATGSLMLTIASLCGSVMTFFGGRIADRIGFKRDIVVCTGLLVVAIVAFVFAGYASVPVLAGVLISLAMMTLQTGYSPIIALSQSYLPNHVGMASGIALGVAVSCGGIVAPILGTVGDSFGLQMVFVIVAIICAGMFVSAIILKSDRRKGSKNTGDGHTEQTGDSVD